MVGRFLCFLMAICVATIANATEAKKKSGLVSPAHSTREVVRLLYGENSPVCKSLLTIYSGWRDKKKELEEYPEAFKKAGFLLPPRKKFSDPSQDPSSTQWHKEFGAGFYQLSLAPNTPPVTILVADYLWRAHGAYSTDVYISRPGEDIDIACSSDFYATDIKHADPDMRCDSESLHNNHLMFAATFSDDSQMESLVADQLVNDKHDFERGGIADKYVYLNFEGRPISNLKIGVGIVSPVIQRLYLFKGAPVFTARDAGGAYAYTISAEGEASDVCYFSFSPVEKRASGQSQD